MEEEQFYDNIQKALENLPENFNILEERIEVEIQMKYFEFARKVREKDIADECFKDRESLFSPETDIERKKEILAAIAGLDEVKAYRTIEKFVAASEGEI